MPALPTSPHVSKNALFWRPDPNRDAARKHPGWLKFHRRCGEVGLYFDDIDREGRGYSCVSFRYGPTKDGVIPMYRVAQASGPGIIEAVLACFDASVAAGWSVPAGVRDLLTAAPVEVGISDDDLLGGPVRAAPVIEDWELV